MKRVMIVTGGSRGIGAATARLAASRGHAVCVNYRKDRDAADAIVEEIEANGGHAIAVATDVSSESDIDNLFKIVDARLGVVTVLFNYAGILEKQSRVENVDAASSHKLLPEVTP